jgi:molybdate transport system substrate-binding protein
MKLPFFSRRLFTFFLVTLCSPFMKADEITVFAAVSLTNALKEIAADYAKSGGGKVVFNFGASGTLEVQIRHGAPADLFFSADELKMNDLEKDGLMLPGSRKDLLSNSLAVVVPDDSTLTLSSAAGLADPKFKKIALGDTKLVPAGIYAKAYLEKLGLWSQIEPRVVPQLDVRAALAAVETGNVDAGIVYKTDALQSHRVKIAYEVPVAEGPAITYPAAIVKDSKHKAAAEKFLDYLGQPGALQTFQRYGFVPKA